MERSAKEPTTLVIFGATGDLARHKLLPALFHLFSNGYLPEQWRIIGLAKDRHTHKEFQDFARLVIQKKAHRHRSSELEEFVGQLSYQSGDFENATTYAKLAELLHGNDNKIFKRCSNKLLYLAVPPSLYKMMFDRLSSSGLSIPCAGIDNTPTGWTRLLVEKPFGHDLETARALDARLGQLFAEDQIFRIDHYLAKETVQNILTFRFANALFEPVWNKQYIEKIEVTLHETIGVGERALFYEGVGALRDVGQNHLLQMLALVTMEDPGELDPHAIRSARSILLQNVRPLTRDTLKHSVVRGQYKGYSDTLQVAQDTATETFFRLQTEITNKRWRGVPVVLEAGKKMAANKVEIRVTFKEPATCVCPAEDHAHQNVLTMHIQPDEGISLLFWAKKPGLTYELEPKKLSFSYQNSEEELMLPDAYEKVLYDCIRGDQTLFNSTDEVSAAWSFTTPILAEWHETPLQIYEPGSSGPK